ncbi:MAG: hypothetical protein K0R54_696 [Clostridiaceae bacterium]|jgi:hypothetical protein|nr:hypothetical protein [Clostridiaceae bacterium]
MKKKLLNIFIMAVSIILSGCSNKNETPTYDKSDVSYAIFTSEEVLYKAEIISKLKENGKEPVYRIHFTNPNNSSLDFTWDESMYNKLLGEDNNALTIGQSVVYLKYHKKNNAFINEMYFKKYKTYSFKDNYVPFTVDNIEDEVEDFLRKVELTQLEQMNEKEENIDKSNYEVDYFYYPKLFGFLVVYSNIDYTSYINDKDKGMK